MTLKSKFLLLYFLLLISCTSDKNKALPYLGNHQTINGKEVYHTIRPFSMVNQDSLVISNTSLNQNVYIADFFFTSCPSICPKVMKQMLRIHDHFRDNEKIKLVSFTIDPKRDNVAKLKKYAESLEVNSNKWFFLTGDKDATLELAGDFFVAALEDASVPGGFDHSGKIILVDRNGHVRAFCEGTDASTIPDFIKNVEKLIDE